jgi:hypothetical protein
MLQAVDFARFVEDPSYDRAVLFLAITIAHECVHSMRMSLVRPKIIRPNTSQLMYSRTSYRARPLYFSILPPSCDRR